jgi:rubrerythrin
MATAENLQDAFAGESQANRKYLAFAKKAEKDGYPQVAKLFRAAAEAETVHAHAHLRVMGGIQDTAANAMAVEETHHDLYTQALEAVKAGKDLSQTQIFVCPVCGHTVLGEAPDKCPVCGALKARFFEVE